MSAATTVVEAAPRPSQSPATRSRASRPRARRTRWSPRRATRRAAASPMPLEAPVTRTTRGGRSWVGIPAGTPERPASDVRGLLDDALHRRDRRRGVAVEDRVPAEGTRGDDVGLDVVEEHDLPGLDAEPAGNELVRRRVGLGEPHLVAVDDVVGDVLEPVAPLALAGAGAGVGQDRGEPRGTLAGEPVEQLAVQGADVPAPEVVHERVDLQVVQTERALPLRADLVLGHLPDHRVAR